MPVGRISKLFHSKAGMLITRAAVLALFLVVLGVRAAYAQMNITPVSWNVIGLDSNNVTVGPDTFQTGARVCNTSGATINNLSASFIWDSANANINLTGPNPITRSSLAAGSCTDFYFSVVVTRTSAAYNTARRYHITVSGNGVGSVSTPTPRELFVEKLISQGRNDVTSISGPTTVYVGQTYSYTVNATTATQGYEQLEAFLDLSNIIFEVQSIATTYTAPPAATNDKFYADACGWDNNPLSGTYRSCIGPQTYGGKAGGTITTVYTVKVLSTGNTTAGTLIRDFSGSSYHYNSDFGQDIISVTALPPPLTLSKSANPTTMTAAGNVVYTLRLTNSGTFPMTVSDFVDTLPTSPGSVTYVTNSSTFNGAAIGNPTISGATLTWNGSFVVPAGTTRDLVFSASLPAVQGTYTNQAIAHMSGFQIDTTQSTADNVPATASVTIGLPDLTIAKTHSGNFTVGVNGTYTLTAGNSGSAATSGTITIVDNLPAGLTIASIPTGTGWNCSTTVVGSSTATCTSSNAIAAGGTGNAITVTVVVAPGAFPSATNAANISGGGEPAGNNGNNSATDPTTVNGVADLRIAKSHSSNFTVGVNGTYTLTASNSGTLATSGTITVVDNLPTGLTIAAIPTGTGWDCSTTVVGSSTATCTSSTVIGAGATSPNPITVTVVVASSAFPSVTNAASISGGGEPAYNNGNNTVTDPTTVNGVADLQVAKSHSGNFTVGINGTYTLTASNSGTLATSGTITVVDNLPAGLTIAATPTGTGWNCSSTVVGSSTATCTSSTVINAGATSPNPITVTVVVAAAAFPSVTNSATISGGGEPAYNNGNNAVTDPTTVNGVVDLQIAKSHSGSFTVGVNGTYTLTASNSGTSATSGTITVVDNLPAGLTIAAVPSGTGWNCSTTVVGSTTATCTSSTVIGAGATSPNPITVTVVVAPAAFPSVTNSASISGGSEPAYNNGNNSVTDPTTVNGVADLRIAKSHSGNFTVGVNGTYTLTASNSGTSATSGTITVVDNLPAGLTIASIPTGTGWNCSTTVVGSSTATCTSSTVIGAGATSPNPITVNVVVAPGAFPSVTNSAAISGGGEPAYNNGNNSVTDPTTVNGIPDMTIVKTHVGNFSQGQVGATYSLTATNSGTAATSGTVTVVDTLPAGLTATGISGTGWSCVLGTLTCTRSDVLAVGSSYPVITVTVTVANNAAASVTNSAGVSGGGENNATNNSANDPTTITQLPDLTIAKSHAGNFTQGQIGATYTLTVTNSGFAATSGTVTVIDTLPGGLTATNISGTGWSCVLGTLTCTRSDALGVGLSYPAITVTVNVSPAAPASVTNSASVSGGGQTNTGNDTATDPATINAATAPNIGLVKSVSPNGTQLPGTDLLYTIAYTNSGGQPANSFILIDPNPLNAVPAERVFHNVDFKIGSMTSSPGTSGLVATFQYSNDGGTTWTYTPVSGGGGAPAGYDRNVTNVRWSFAGSLSQTAPNNTGSVTLTVRIR